METLQNNFTTPEQSKRMLVLGVPADSADCYYAPFTRGVQVRHEPYELRSTFFDEYPFSPCWSVGRLMEIFLLCTPYKDIALNTSDLIEQMVVSLFMVNKDGLLDFSKLEE